MENPAANDPFEEKIVQLRSLVNSLVIQNLACGNIPKIKPGVEMNPESLMKLKEELDLMISQSLKHSPNDSLQMAKQPIE